METIHWQQTWRCFISLCSAASTAANKKGWGFGITFIVTPCFLYFLQRHFPESLYRHTEETDTCFFPIYNSPCLNPFVPPAPPCPCAALHCHLGVPRLGALCPHPGRLVKSRFKSRFRPCSVSCQSLPGLLVFVAGFALCWEHVCHVSVLGCDGRSCCLISVSLIRCLQLRATFGVGWERGFKGSSCGKNQCAKHPRVIISL